MNFILNLSMQDQSDLLNFMASLDSALSINEDAELPAGQRRLPPKFHLANDSVAHILLGKETNEHEVTGLLDCIGGYFSALHHSHVQYGTPAPDGDAIHIMDLADRLVQKVNEKLGYAKLLPLERK